MEPYMLCIHCKIVKTPVPFKLFWNASFTYISIRTSIVLNYSITYLGINWLPIYIQRSITYICRYLPSRDTRGEKKKEQSSRSASELPRSSGPTCCLTNGLIVFHELDPVSLWSFSFLVHYCFFVLLCIMMYYHYYISKAWCPDCNIQHCIHKSSPYRKLLDKCIYGLGKYSNLNLNTPQYPSWIDPQFPLV